MSRRSYNSKKKKIKLSNALQDEKKKERPGIRQDCIMQTFEYQERLKNLRHANNSKDHKEHLRKNNIWTAERLLKLFKNLDKRLRTFSVAMQGALKPH